MALDAAARIAPDDGQLLGHSRDFPPTDAKQLNAIFIAP
jgi:hypothetical protein